MKKTVPEYVRNLEALGVDTKQLWNEREQRFLRRKELIQRVGEEEFKVLETVGRTIRKGRWKGEVKVDHTLNAFLDEFGDVKFFPEEAKRILSQDTADSLILHYLKRKFIDRWNLKNPEELDEMFVKHLKNPEGLIYKQGDRIAVELDRFVAIVHPPDTKITLFELDEQYEDYEDYAKQTGRSILKLWQLKHILRRL